MRAAVIAFAAVAGFAAAAAEEAPPAYWPAESAKRVLDKDVATIVQWLDGAWDNSEQWHFAREQNVAEELRNPRVHSIFRKVDLPALGENVFYVQQYLNDDPAKIYRQRFYVFAADYAKQAVRLDILTPKDAEAVKDAHLDPSKLAGMTADAVEATPGCEVYWRRNGEHFNGAMVKDACRVVSERLGKTIVINDDLMLSETELWINDQARDEQGGYVFGNKANEPVKVRKLRPFSCWVSTLKPGSDPEDQANWSFAANQPIHDQGGRLWLEPGEKANVKVGLKMRNVVWPYGRNQPSLVLYVYDEANPEKAVSYSWADPDATRVGINLRWMQASCSLAKE
jgi:hypothetical protein